MTNPELLFWLVPLAPLLGCILCVFLAFRGDTKWAHLPAVASLLLSAGVTLYQLFSWVPGEAGMQLVSGYRFLEVGGISLDLALRIDTLSLTLLSVVTPISAMISIYSIGYMHDDRGYARYFAVFCGFVFCMTMLVLSHNLLMTYIFWEGVGTCSYLLIGFWYQRPTAAKAATKAFLVNRIADTAFTLAILLLSYAVGQTLAGAEVAGTGRLDFSTIFNVAPELSRQHQSLLNWICCLLMIGAIGKSAQFPFHVWLPDAMEGPTPVSALIHAATMVTAGVFLMCRLAPLMAYAPAVLVLVAWLGGITSLLAALMAMCQHDLKRVLAYSTVSQLGYLFMALGTGASNSLMTLGVTAAMFHLVTHAFFKALLFLSAGNVMHAMGDVIDMRQFSGLRRTLPLTHLLFAVGAAALAGVPLLSGFFSKDSVLGLLADARSDFQYGEHFSILLWIGFATAVCTSIYISNAYFRTFFGPEKLPPEAGHHAHEASPTMLLPMLPLAIGAVFSGWLLGPTGKLAEYISLSPLFHHHEHHEPAWILIASAAISISGIVVGWLMSRTPFRPGAISLGLYGLGQKGFLLEDLYRAIIVWPATVLGKVLGWLDTKVILAVTDAFAELPRRLGWFGQQYETGRISTYSLLTALGVAVAAIWIVIKANW